MTELETALETAPPPLTYAEFINILSIVAVRLQRQEELFEGLLQGLDRQTEFQNYEIFKMRVENMRENDKTPLQRLRELENQFRGLVQFANDNFYKSKKQKPKSEYD